VAPQHAVGVGEKIFGDQRDDAAIVVAQQIGQYGPFVSAADGYVFEVDVAGQITGDAVSGGLVFCAVC